MKNIDAHGAKKFVITGKVAGGKVALDPSALDAVAGGAASSTSKFRAVNAPFDPIAVAA